MSLCFCFVLYVYSCAHLSLQFLPARIPPSTDSSEPTLIDSLRLRAQQRARVVPAN